MEIEELNQSEATDIIIHDMRQGLGHVPHEWIFINLLLRKHLAPAITPVKFVAFVEQYFPKYLWNYINYYDMVAMVAIECNYHDYNLRQHYLWNMDVSQEKLDYAFKFGEIVTQFCIQCLNYSLIGCGGSKAIITAQNQCDKKFDKYLSEGYWLYRMAKVYYIPPRNDILGYFEELPVLPTNNMYYDSVEYIPTPDQGHSQVLK